MPVIFRLMPLVTAGVTVNDTLKVWDVIPVPPETVTIAVYSPASKPVAGRTVNAVLPPCSIFGIEVWGNIKEEGFVPESAAVKFPVGWFPVLFIVTVCGDISA